MRYNKPPLSAEKQASRLIERGLICPDLERLKHYLTHIGYYRLSAYWLPFELPSDDGAHRNHTFQDGTTFDRVLDLYDFDRKLRLLVMDAIERIEVAVRTCWANGMALKYGPHAYLDSLQFKNPWQHIQDIARLSKIVENSQEACIVHYRRTYPEPLQPPIWSSVEVMSFGHLSRWLQNTKDNEVKKEVAKSLGLPTVELLEKILHVFTPMRNTCAHHGRLWNRQFAMKLPEFRRLRERLVPNNAPDKQANKMFNYLVIIEYLKATINPRGTWKTQLVEHLKTVPMSDLLAMGFPVDWKEREPWTGAFL